MSISRAFAATDRTLRSLAPVGRWRRRPPPRTIRASRTTARAGPMWRGARWAAASIVTGLAIDGDGAGGAYAVWIADHETRAVRVGAGGAIVGGWPAEGLLLGTSPDNTDVKIFPSGAGRIAVWLDRPSGTNSGRLTLQRFLYNGTLDP